EYERGKAMYPVRSIGETNVTGTKVTFKPDASIFTQTLEYSYDTLAARLRELSFLNKGITITLTDLRNIDENGHAKSEIFHSTEALPEYVRFGDGNRAPITTHVVSTEKEATDTPVD